MLINTGINELELDQLLSEVETLVERASATSDQEERNNIGRQAYRLLVRVRKEANVQSLEGPRRERAHGLAERILTEVFGELL